MEIAKLKYFYTTAKLGNVTRAAEEIHIAQPALTKAIKLLEQELDVPLFYKKGRNIYLTAFGEYLKSKLDTIFPLLDKIPDELNELKEKQRLTVKLNVLAASTAVTDAVVNYKKAHPEVVFEMIQNETERDCDVSVSATNADFKGLPKFEKKRVLEEKIYLAVPSKSRYATKQSIALKEVEKEEFVTLAGSRLFRSLCDGFCAYAGFKPQITFESDSPTAVRNIIGAHAGIGFWPAYSWGKTSAEVTLIPITEPICQREIILGLHENAKTSAVAQDFYEYLSKFLRRKQEKGKKTNK